MEAARGRRERAFFGVAGGADSGVACALPCNQIPEGDFSGYIFDLDGTLVDTMPLHYLAWEAGAQEGGPQGQLDENYFYALGGVPSRKVAALLGKHHGLKLDPERVYKDKEEIFMASLQKLELIGPVVDFARRVSKTGPSRSPRGGRGTWSRARSGRRAWPPLFPVVVTADDVEHGKPAPDMFLLAAKRMGVPRALPRLRGRRARDPGRGGRRDEVGLRPEPAVRVR
jgi:beta-phosphoglucomutase-like phosphatase (HAD superfamily)